jgi:hypothetical protein
LRTEVEPADGAPHGARGQTLRFGEAIQSPGLHWYAELLDHLAHAVLAARAGLATGAAEMSVCVLPNVDVLAVPPH